MFSCLSGDFVVWACIYSFILLENTMRMKNYSFFLKNSEFFVDNWKSRVYISAEQLHQWSTKVHRENTKGRK